MSGYFVIDVNNMQPFTRGDGPIVVVDDDDALILLVKSCYRKSGRTNKLICITESDAFLSYVQDIREKKNEMPEVVLLDINMPKKSGFDILEEIRQIKDFEKVPVIVMFTASDSEADMEKAKKLLANAFFSKPNRIEDYIKFFQQI